MWYYYLFIFKLPKGRETYIHKNTIYTSHSHMHTRTRQVKQADITTSFTVGIMTRMYIHPKIAYNSHQVMANLNKENTMASNVKQKPPLWQALWLVSAHTDRGRGNPLGEVLNRVWTLLFISSIKLCVTCINTGRLRCQLHIILKSELFILVEASFVRLYIYIYYICLTYIYLHACEGTDWLYVCIYIYIYIYIYLYI